MNRDGGLEMSYMWDSLFVCKQYHPNLSVLIFSSNHFSCIVHCIVVFALIKEPERSPKCWSIKCFTHSDSTLLDS